MALLMETEVGRNLNKISTSIAKKIVFDFDNIAVEINNLTSKKDLLMAGDSSELGKLNNIFKDIKNAWAGKDSDAFRAKYNDEYQPYIEKTIEQIDVYINALKMVSKKLQDVEDTLSAM